MRRAWPILPTLILLLELSLATVGAAPCQTCQKLAESFIKVPLLRLRMSPLGSSPALF